MSGKKKSDGTMGPLARGPKVKSGGRKMSKGKMSSATKKKGK